MKTITKEYQVFYFDELSDEAKEKAIEKAREWACTDDFWHDFLIDDAKEIGRIIGIDIKNIYFSGFSSQGDGACFEGSYEYRKGSVKELKKYAPKDKELHRIVLELSKIQRKFFYQLSATVKQSGHYMHEMCTDIDVYNDADNRPGWSNEINEYEDAVKELLRDYMRWIYKILEKEFEYQTSDEVLIENIKINGYEFNADGSLF